MIRKRIANYRPITCCLHSKLFRGHGITLVMRKVVFNFCAECWSGHRKDCEEHMRRVTA